MSETIEELKSQPAIIAAITGPQASGKTILLHYLCMVHHSNGGRILSYWGNDICIPNGQGGYRNIAESPDGDFSNALLAIDSGEFLWDAKIHADNSWAKLDYLKQQTGLVVLIAVQSFDFLLPEVQDSVRFIFKCSDPYSVGVKSYEGKRIKRGEILRVNFYDRCVDWAKQPISHFILDAKSLWASVLASTNKAYQTAPKG